MASGEEWLWRPMMAGLCRYESMVDGTLDLAAVALMNELLDLRAENEARFAAASEPQSEYVRPPPPGGRVA